ncbi:MAG: hypothetical protein ABI863_10125 [Ginsengibacter sp.]
MKKIKLTLPLAFALVIKDLASQNSNEILRSNKTPAAPSVAYYRNTYFLLVEEFTPERDKRLTNAFQSDYVDKEYKRVINSPILSNNDACAFQYVINNKLYGSYSHCINLKESIWI